VPDFGAMEAAPRVVRASAPAPQPVDDGKITISLR
jgi:hypothetical protein